MISLACYLNVANSIGQWLSHRLVVVRAAVRRQMGNLKILLKASKNTFSCRPPSNLEPVCIATQAFDGITYLPTYLPTKSCNVFPYIKLMHNIDIGSRYFATVDR